MAVKTVYLVVVEWIVHRNVSLDGDGHSHQNGR